MRVLISEPEHVGHYLQWLAYAAAAFHQRGDQVIVVSSATARASAAWEEFMGPRAASYEVITLPYMGHTPRRWISRAKRMRYAVALARVVRQLRPDLVFIPSMDALVVPLAILAALRPPFRDAASAEGILHTVVDAYPEARRGLRNRLVGRVRMRLFTSGCCRRILCCDDLAHEYLTQLEVPGLEIATCAQPVTHAGASGDRMRARLCLDPETAVVAGVGLQDERKGSDLLLRAFLRRPARRGERLVLAGVQSPAFRRLLAAERSRSPDVAWRVIAVDRFLSVDEMRDVIDAADVVAAVHPRQVGTSDSVWHAVAAGKPVLASSYGWIGYFVRRHRLGWVGDTQSPAELDRGLEWAFAGPRIDRASTGALLRRCTFEQFCEDVCGKAR